MNTKDIQCTYRSEVPEIAIQLNKGSQLHKLYYFDVQYCKVYTNAWLSLIIDLPTSFL